MTGLLALLTVAGDARAVDIPIRDDHPAAEVACYDSGMQVAVEADPRRPVVAVTLVVSGGSAHDPTEKRGRAHLTEHLLFQAERDGVRHMDRIQAVGAAFNAYTTPDSTVWALEAPAPALPALLDTQAGLLASETLEGLDETALEQERNVVHHERARRGDRTGMAAAAWLAPVLVPDGAAVVPVGDETPATLDRVALDDVQDFVGTWFRPEHATVVVRGDVEPMEVWPAVEAAFGPVGLGTRDPTGASCSPEHTDADGWMDAAVDPSLRIETATVSAPTVLLGWRLPSVYAPEALALRGLVQQQEDRLIDLVDRLSDSRLRADDRPDCQMLGSVGGSLAVCVVPIPRGYEPGVFVDAVRGALDRAPMADWGPEAALKKGLRIARQDARGVVSGLSLVSARGGATRDRFVHFTGEGDWLGALDAPLRSRGVAPPVDILAGNRAAAVLLEPPPGFTRRALGEAPALVDPRDARSSLDRGPRTGGSEGGAGIAARAPTITAPLFDLPPAPPTGTPMATELPNGTTLLVLPQEGPRNVRVTAFHRIPVELTPAEMLLGDALRRWKTVAIGHGVPRVPRWAGRTAGLDGRAVYVGDRSGASFFGDAAQLPTLLMLANSHLANGVVHERMLPSTLRWLGRIDKEWRADPWGMLRSEAVRHAAGGDARWDALGQVQAARALGKGADADRIGDAVEATRGALLVVVGNVDPERVTRQASDALRRWTGPNPPVADPAAGPLEPPPRPGRPMVSVRTDRDADQSTAMLTCRLPDDLDPLLAEGVQRWLWLTAFSVLREGAGLTYTPQVWVDTDWRGFHQLVVALDTEPEQTEDAMRGLVSLMRTAATAPVPPATLAAVDNAARSARARDGLSTIDQTLALVAARDGSGAPQVVDRPLSGDALQEAIGLCVDAPFLGAVVPPGVSTLDVIGAAEDALSE